MKNRVSGDNRNGAKEKIKFPDSIRKNRKKMEKNMKRLGGSGLSLESFANAKTKSKHYNPALIKKQQEFYKNAKYVRKYRRSLNQQRQGLQNNPVLYPRALEDYNGSAENSQMSQKRKKNVNFGARSLEEMYEKKHEEAEKAKIESEAIIQAKKEDREKAEARRKSLREKIFKKTKSGQPVMKYRIEHLLETLQNSTT